MNTPVQIMKLFEATQTLREVQKHATPIVAEEIENIISTIADLADEIEGI